MLLFIFLNIKNKVNATFGRLDNIQCFNSVLINLDYLMLMENARAEHVKAKKTKKPPNFIIYFLRQKQTRKEKTVFLQNPEKEVKKKKKKREREALPYKAKPPLRS